MPNPLNRSVNLNLLSIAVIGIAVGCGQPPVSREPIRLVDRFGEAVVAEAPAVEVEPQAWRFDQIDSPDDSPWQAATGIEGLRLEDSALAARSADDFPLLYVPIQAPEGGDSLYTVHLRLRSDTAGKLTARVMDGPPSGPRGRIEGIFPWPFSTEVEASEEWQDVRLTASSEVPVEDEAYLVVRPIDDAGAKFALDSAEIAFRRDSFLTGEPGISWQGVQNIYKETLVTRAGDEVSYDLHLPAHSWLDVSTSQVGGAGARFEVAVDDGNGERIVFDDTPEASDAWQPAAVDLAEFSGQQVQLKLRLASAGEGAAVGLWGAPVIRTRMSEGDGPRGVIVIVTDTLRRDHLSIYGYHRDTSPNLARLAEEGVVALDPISQSSWTKLAVTSLFTSMYPSSHGVKQFHDRLPASAETMAEIYRDAGYATIGMSSIPFTGKFTNLHQGYETLHEASSLESTKAKTARIYVQRLLPWLEAQKDGKFFVFLHVADPHSPYEPYEPYDDFYAEDGDVEEYIRQQNAVRPFIEHSELMRVFGMPRREELVAADLDPEEYVDYELNSYDGSIRGMDDELQKVIDKLGELEIEDQVLIGVVSDHGTEFLDHDAHFHGHTVYGELNQVPLILWAPGFVPAGVRLDGPVQTIDLMPTLLDLSGLPVPEQAQGQSLAPAITGDLSLRRRPAFTEVYAEEIRGFGDPAGEFNWWSVTTEDWKMVVKRPVGSDEDLPGELYDRSEDPLDKVNVASNHPETVADLTRQLNQWRAAAEQARLASDEELGATLSEEEAEELRSLGYLQ